MTTLFDSALTELISVPLLFVDNTGCVRSNTSACELFGIAPEVALDDMASSFYSDDGIIFRTVATEAGENPSSPVIVRWGLVAPVTYIEATARRIDDETVIIVAVDRTEQYRLDASATSISGSALFFADPNGLITWVSPFSARVLSTTCEDLIGRDLTDLVHPDDLNAFRRRLKDVVDHPGAPISGSFKFRHPSAIDTWWPVRMTTAYYPNRPAIGSILIRVDLVVEIPGSDSSSHGPGLQSLAEIAPAGIIAAAGGRLNLRNALARNIIGPTLDDFDPFAWVAVVREDQRPELLRRLQEASEEGHRSSMTVAIERSEGDTRWLRIEIFPTTSESGSYVGFMATLLDITTEMTQNEVLRKAQSQLWELANHDTLTGLPNRMYFCDRLTNALARQRRESRNVGLIFGDLDRFKPVNDTFGHAVGDQVLAVVADRIKGVTRETDTVSRYGGDEFLVLCDDFTDVNEIQAIASRIIEVVSEPIFIDGNEISIGMSIGIATARDGIGTETLLKAADNAMYEAKRQGRGRAVLASQELADRPTDHVQPEEGD